MGGGYYNLELYVDYNQKKVFLKASKQYGNQILSIRIVLFYLSQSTIKTFLVFITKLR